MLEVEEKIMSTKNYLMHLKSETKKGKGLSRATNMAIFFFLKKEEAPGHIRVWSIKDASTSLFG